MLRRVCRVREREISKTRQKKWKVVVEFGVIVNGLIVAGI